jgi:hypothetical protein
MKTTSVTIDEEILNVVRVKRPGFELSDFVRRALEIEAGIENESDISENEQLKKRLRILTAALEDANKRLSELGG